MKLSKTSLLVISAGFLIIMMAGLGVVYFQKVDERNQFSEQLALAQSGVSGMQIELLSSQQTDLEGQLSQAISQFEAVKVILSQPISSVTVWSILFDVAKAHDLEITEITSSGLTSDSLEGITYSVLSLTVKIEGDVPNLVNFVTQLNSYFTTGVVKSVVITVPETTNGESASANIEVIIYTYRGD